MLEKKFVERQNSITVVMENWDKNRVHLVHLGENVIQLDNWQENRCTKMMT